VVLWNTVSFCSSDLLNLLGSISGVPIRNFFRKDGGANANGTTYYATPIHADRD
jgi:hypothetical protein